VKVLVIDDDEGSRKLACDLLKLKNVDSIEAGSGIEALTLLSPEINFCITDINLPDMDGYEIARRIKEKYPKMPIIVCTASVSKIERIKITHMDHLFNATLLKPVSMKDFNEVIGRFL
jgi:CheY-like chemotaxis protein